MNGTYERLERIDKELFKLFYETFVENKSDKELDIILRKFDRITELLYQNGIMMKVEANNPAIYHKTDTYISKKIYIDKSDKVIFSYQFDNEQIDINNLNECREIMKMIREEIK